MILRLKFLFTLLIFLFILTAPPEAWADWVKHPTNPVVGNSQNGWDSLSVRSPAVIYDNGQFKMYYQGQTSNSNWQIGIAYSSDGITWTKNSDNPIITPSDSYFIGEIGLEEPAILKDNLYRMWYKNDPNSTIRYATSSGGIVWNKYEKPVLINTDYWENLGVANPAVILKDGKYWMYYTAWGVDNGWRLGLATSSDGITWTKYEKNPLDLPIKEHAGRPAVIYYNGKVHLFYHTGYGRGTDIYHLISEDGINFSCENNQCSILTLGLPGSFDSNTIIGPAVVEHNSKLYLYYGGTSDNNHWQIGLASEQPIVVENKKTPLIILPGMFASWNKEAIIHNQIVATQDWILNPVVHEYDGIIQTLDNLGYQKNTDYFIFNYDWRKGLNSLADDFNAYVQQLTNANPTTKYNLLGHSLGGLVGRIYLQKYGVNNVNKLITIGTPHLGTANSYKPVEGGEFDTKNSLMWLGQKIILQINKDGLKTDKQIIAEKIPIAKDLLPTDDFLKKQNNQDIAISNMEIKNDTLLSYTTGFPNIFSSFQTFYGEKGDTTYGYKVTNRTLLDQLLDLYPDGRPQETINAPGDYVITSKSAGVGNNPINLNSLDHGEIIYSKASIKKILDNLSINYQDTQVVEGSSAQIFPSIIFLVMSPVSLEVEYSGQLFPEQQGIVLINNAEFGNYVIKAKGQAPGRYTILTGQLINNTDQWTRIEGEIKTLPQTDTYHIEFNGNNQMSFISTENLFDELILYLTDLNKTLKKNDITKSILYLNQAKKYYRQKNFPVLKRSLSLTHKHLFDARSKVILKDKSNLFYAIEKLETLYGKSLTGYNHGYFPSLLKISLTIKKKIIPIIQEFLLIQKNKEKNIQYNSLILLIIDNKLKLAEKSIKDKNYNLAEIYLMTVGELLKEVRKL